MYNSHIAQVLWLVIVLTTILAVWKGGVAERIGALLNFLIAALDVPLHFFLDKDAVASAMLVADFALALGFLLLAVRYASIWLGGAMLLAAVQFSLHAYYIIDERAHDRTYAWINNLDTFGVVLLILASAIMAWRRQARDTHPQTGMAVGAH